MERYVYKDVSSPLNLRVLVVEPAETIDAPLRCSIQEVSWIRRNKKQTAAYDALSYTWGAPVREYPLLCDGQTVLVTRNCVSALRYLRLQREKLVIWVDAVCIDQESIADKNFWVPAIGLIFSCARHVYIWLGESGEATAGLFKALKYERSWMAVLPRNVAKFLAPCMAQSNLGSSSY